MARSDFHRPFIEEVRVQAAFGTEAEAAHATDAVFDALGELLTSDEAHAISAHVPERLGGLLQKATERELRRPGCSAVVPGVAWRENVDRGIAFEHITAVCEVLSARLPDEVRQKLRADLPADVAALLAARSDGVRHVDRDRSQPESRHPTTLAEGRPMSSHSLSEGHPRAAQENSVAEPNPHADTKLSSARGLTQERLGETLKDGGPAKRTIARG